MTPSALPRRSLTRRYAVLVGVITLVLLLASGGSEMYFGYRSSREQIANLQAVQAEAAAREIEQYLRIIEAGLRDAAKMPWGQPDFGLAQKREEFYRLMVLFPAIVELQAVNARGLEELFVSKSEPDRLGSALPFPSPALLELSPALPLRYGPTLYRESAEPFVQLALPDPGPGRSVNVATINLRFLGDVVSGLRVGDSGRTYVVDADNHLIAHPRATHVLRKLDLADFGPVRAARAAVARDGKRLLASLDSVDVDGQPAIVTALRLRSPEWLVFVDQPRSEALQPAIATLTRTVLLVALGGGLALLASIFFARRMARPIVGLRHATQRIAAGDLDFHIALDTGDEIQQLAEDFNQMAGKLRESYSGLEAKVEERTAQLSQARDSLEGQAREMAALNVQLGERVEELALRRDEAERANAAKTRFLAAASHDLRQPMHSIGLLVGVLRSRLAEPGHLQLAEKVQRSVSAMEHLFSSLLDISKLDAGAIRPARESFEIGALLRQIEQVYAPQAGVRGLEFRLRAPRALVRSDPVLLERIVGNLVANAIRYTRSGGLLVACRPRGSDVAIQVWDTGIGIPELHLDDIFEEFYRLRPAGPEADNGLGLGLSIVKRSADILGHRLAVRSRTERGSVFEIVVPRADGTSSPREVQLQDPGARARLAGAFVLVVDDDEANRQALEALCLQWGCHVQVAGALDEALAGLAQHLRSPDLILTDFRLAGPHDGFDVVERVRQLAGEAVPAIVLTADAVEALQERAAARGATLLGKPASVDKLLRACAAALTPPGPAD